MKATAKVKDRFYFIYGCKGCNHFSAKKFFYFSSKKYFLNGGNRKHFARLIFN